jgi:glycosyltransferase involved in cell wall biosynthesis
MGEETMNGPRVSVIVPTRNRAASLERLLASLHAQSFADFEIVVVDDGSTDATPRVAQAWDRVRYVRGDGAGAVGARCLGVKTARGEVLAFTDDDCLVDARWLETGVAAIDGGADVVQGRTVPQRELVPLERTVQHGADDGLFPTCNVFYRRSAYDRVGGFDTVAGDRLGFRRSAGARALGFGEDTLLGWAVARSGTSAAVPEALVSHEVVRPPIRELLYREWVAGAFPSLLREVPELRRTLIRKRIVLGRPNERLGAYGLVLLLVPPLQLAGVVVGLWWITARTRRLMRRPGSLPRRLIALPVELALDVMRAVALISGSVRAKTLVV